MQNKNNHENNQKKSFPTRLQNMLQKIMNVNISTHKEVHPAAFSTYNIFYKQGDFFKTDQSILIHYYDQIMHAFKLFILKLMHTSSLETF